MNVRKYYTIKETIRGETYGKSGEPIDRVAAMAVFDNPFTGEFVEDLSSLFELGGEIAMQLSDDAVRVLHGRLQVMERALSWVQREILNMGRH